jgi:hypothetical protein
MSWLMVPERRTNCRMGRECGELRDAFSQFL